MTRSSDPGAPDTSRGPGTHSSFLILALVSDTEGLSEAPLFFTLYSLRRVTLPGGRPRNFHTQVTNSELQSTSTPVPRVDSSSAGTLGLRGLE